MTQPQPKLYPRAIRAFAEFFRLEAAGGIVLILAAAFALICVNSPLSAQYKLLLDLPVAVTVGPLGIDKPALLWVNDGLMAVFFLLVALEIKRELVGGQLQTRQQRILPMVCAVAGTVVPALIFTAFNHGDKEAMRGWAIPTATDIAFALGVLALLGSRVPIGMKVLLSTIAVVDDLLAIIVIAVFYSHEMSYVALGAAFAMLAAMFVLKQFGVKSLVPYLVLGIVLWICMVKSGVHATLAGVATGLLIPHVDKRNKIDDAIEYSPLETLEHQLHPWVAFGILPVFAFFNAGLELGNLQLSQALAALPFGVAVGLLAGKPIGIVGTAITLRALGWARYPEGMDHRAMLGLGFLCGIGFTMSLFIASLAYIDPVLYEEAVLGIFVASVLAALTGLAWLRAVLPARAAA
ncbi:Na+/H+ antiporter NhaA [Lysobacter sp. A6]|uniref:Na(+)/H(+) antiporter NhaA n=1 Tax=Noviluteimonas lactosilytica TaxID=2888523 RepID=A0ABS8JGJ8_9GAMM|nr:Na+/H+ antiporter NhaA [Lysobacter lactosilyticus]MCC8362738.1 Na+/H+ antiporter NhaA [Lysobacter lactosilyticus]